jgi:hypothetical protein
VITLRNDSYDGLPLEATFLPSKGMNLISYKKGGIEVIDQTTKALFDERYAGLGALIGPHFHHRSVKDIQSVPFEDRFPHIARVKAKGIKEPFSHGIARYAPWSCSAKGSSLRAKISSDDTWEGVLLSELEGYSFAMYMDVELKSTGLFIELSVEAERPSVVGTHYYYALGSDDCLITADNIETFFDGKDVKNLPKEWRDTQGLCLPIKGAIDSGFFPKNVSNTTSILLHTTTYRLDVTYQSHTDEGSFQIFHPQNASYVCIEPLSATFPRCPKLLSSGVNIEIGIHGS